MALIIIIISLASTVFAGAILHFREREANKNGHGLDTLKKLIEK